MRERKAGNNDIKHIIICNYQEFFFIDAKEYEKYFNDRKLKKALEACDNKQGTNTSTKEFYKIAETYLQATNDSICYTYFKFTDDISFSTLSLIYQAFSPKVLLKTINFIDANTLNQKFYDELLYILGLHEIAEGAKVLIKPSSTPNTLLDSICKAYGLNPTLDFESIFTLLTTWNNRILFLRLLESMLLSFKHIDTPFLQIDRIRDFPTLNTLFFEVLAKKEKERSNIPRFLESIPYLNSSLFDRSALELDGKEIKLLDSKPLELYVHSILHKDEAFKRDYKDQKSLPLLEYLFAFLRAYDFTTIPSDIKDNIKINQNKLINSAVLGLVFEKLNGYQEGSFYTPSFITNYMGKQSLEKVVLDKFNQAKGWDCQDLESLKFKIDKLTDSKDGYKQANAIFDSIKICDPSVGSGHFLVSVLNWLIYLKFKLKILCDENYERLKDITLDIQNDEILIRDSNNKIFSYALPAHDQIESHKLQKALFQAKRKLIESCLFGVDINPNSCEITKLRLWIELLKFSYYKDIEQRYLETLPNIDINIKCGNSLVSNIALDMTKESLEKELKDAINKGARLEMHEDFTAMANALNKLPERIESYKNAVNAYKNETNSDLKKLHQRQIAESKDFIVKIFHTMSAEYRVFKSSLASYLKEYGYFGIDEAHIDDKPLESSLNKSLNDHIIAFNFHKSLDIPKDARGYSTKELLSLIDSMHRYENLLSDRSTFEWRFEFPEVLDSNGDFIGFDLVIGNPPYIRQEHIKHLKPHLQKHFDIYTGTSDIYTYFFEQGYKILCDDRMLSFITSNKWTRAGYGKALRDFLLKNITLQAYVELNGIKVFENASVDTSILSFQKSKPRLDSTFIYAHPKDYDPKSNEYLDINTIAMQTPQSSLNIESFTFSSPEVARIKEKIEKIGTPLKDWDIKIYRGILTGYNEAFIISSEKREEILNACANQDERNRTTELIKPILRGRDIKRYSYEWADLWLINTHNGYKKIMNNQEIEIQSIDIDHYPAIKAHLDTYWDKISKRYDKGATPYNLRNCAYIEDFAKEKISWQRVTQEPSFILESDFCLLDSMAFLVSYSKDELIYLLGFLNTKTIFYYFKHIGHLYSDKGFLLSNQYIERFPIPKIFHIDKQIQEKIVQCVKEILELKKQNLHSNTSPLESELDSLIYQFYGLDDSEISLIESEFTDKERDSVIENIYHLLDVFINSHAVSDFIPSPTLSQYQGKIIWAEMTKEPCFVYDDKGIFINQTCYFIPRDDHYLVAILNSKLIYFYMKEIASNLGDGAFRWIKQFIEKLPVIQDNAQNEKRINTIKTLSSKLHALKNSSNICKNDEAKLQITRLESRIDSAIYALYGLDDKQIEIIESTFINGGGAITILLNKFYTEFNEFFSNKILQEKRETPSTTDLFAQSPKYEGKIIYSEIVQSPQFYLDEQGFFAEATSFILNGENLHYLLGMLNSKLISFAFKNFYAGGGLGEKGYRYKKAFLERLPIPRLKHTQEEEFVQIIKEILESKKAGKDTQELESRLDSMIFDLYGLNELERQLVNPPPAI